MSITCLSHRIPVDENAYSGQTHVDADHHVPEKDPVGDEVLVVLSGWFAHNVSVRRVETKGSCWGSISDQIDPK